MSEDITWTERWKAQFDPTDGWRGWWDARDEPYLYISIEIVHPDIPRPVIVRTLTMNRSYIPQLLWRPLPGAHRLG